MAVERDFELLDDYLSNRMSGEEKSAFEQKLASDSELKQEVKFQQELVEGLRKARVTELKSVLNNVPIAPVAGGETSLLVKAGAWVAITGLVATGLYFYFSDDQSTAESKTIVAEEPAAVEQPEPEASNVEPKTSEPLEPTEEPGVKEELKAEKPTVKKPVEKPEPAESRKPGVAVYDPSQEEVDPIVEKYEREQLEIISKAFVTSSIEVETDNTNKKYAFHYVFKDGKLVLYGGFEKHLYEILEFISDDKRTVVLFYKANYYLLDIHKSTPTLLTPIRDKALLKKLQEYRGKQE